MKELFVFGAGASKASAGTPLGSELGWEYFQGTSTFYKMEGGRPAEDDVIEKKTQYASLREFLCVVEKYYPKRFAGESEKLDKTIESGQTYLSPFLALNEDDSAKKYYIDELLEEIIKKKDLESQHIILRVVFEHIITTSWRNGNSLYEQFVDKVLKDRLKEDITIISFNFDALLREYGKGHPKDYVYFDYMINFDCLNWKYYKYVRSNCFPLIKLHGSLDWGICRKCDKVTLNFYHTHVQNFMGCPNCKTEYEPFIVVPHENIEDKRIKQLWDNAAEELQHANKITVIGYSFPEYDTKAIELFRDNSKDGTAIEVIDYKVSEKEKNMVISHYKKQFGDTILKNIRFNFDGFEKYIANFTT